MRWKVTWFPMVVIVRPLALTIAVCAPCYRFDFSFRGMYISDLEDSLNCTDARVEILSVSAGSVTVTTAVHFPAILPLGALIPDDFAAALSPSPKTLFTQTFNDACGAPVETSDVIVAYPSPPPPPPSPLPPSPPPPSPPPPSPPPPRYVGLCHAAHANRL